MKLPQLSLRELFLLVALAAMGCGWWVRERQLRSEIKAGIDKLEAEKKRGNALAYKLLRSGAYNWPPELYDDLQK
jgi:hypothetical protein